jgi:hypothetical protein
VWEGETLRGGGLGSFVGVRKDEIEDMGYG